MGKRRAENFAPLITLVRGRISLTRNKRLRKALSGEGKPSARLDEELPAAVVLEWNEMRPGEEPPASGGDVNREDLATLTNRAARRIEKQADDGERIIEAVENYVRRAPAGARDEEELYELDTTLRKIVRKASLSGSEREVYLSLTDDYVDDKDIPHFLDLSPETFAKYKYRMMKKLREAAEELGYSGKFM